MQQKFIHEPVDKRDHRKNLNIHSYNASTTKHAKYSHGWRRQISHSNIKAQ